MQIVKLSSNFVKFCFGKNIYSSNVIYLYNITRSFQVFRTQLRTRKERDSSFFYDQTLHDCLSVAFFDYLEKGSIPWVIAETLKKRLSKDHIIR